MASVQETVRAINDACKVKGGVYREYSCQSVSWDDVSRGTVGGALSCWGANITDTRLWAKDGRQLFTVRSDNWNEKLGGVSASEVAIVTGNHAPGGEADLRPVTLRDLLANVATSGGYAGIPSGTDLSHVDLDKKVSIRFQTTFLPVGEEDLAAMEFCSEAYNYNTRSDSDPRNLVLLCTSQGVAVQQDGCGAKRLYHHAVDKDGTVHRYWLEAEKSRHKVGGAQVETEEERVQAAARGKATSSVIGVRAMGTRFNVLMNIQVPLQQAPPTPPPEACTSGASWGCDEMDLFSMGSQVMCAPPSWGMNDVMKSMGMSSSKKESWGPPMPMMGGMSNSMSSQIAISKAPMPSPCLQSAKRSRGAPPKVGAACAARVSRGAEFDTWKGLTVETPKRGPSEHVTCTVVIYNAVSGGVPSQADVIAAIDDLEQLYSACSAKGHLADQQFDFMKEELAVKDLMVVEDKIKTQPYKPPVQSVVGYNAFPL